MKLEHLFAVALGAEALAAIYFTANSIVQSLLSVDQAVSRQQADLGCYVGLAMIVTGSALLAIRQLHTPATP